MSISTGLAVVEWGNTKINILESLRSTDSPAIGEANSRMLVGIGVRMIPNDCDVDCMCVADLSDVKDPNALRFLQAVMGDSLLRWAGEPSNFVPTTTTVLSDYYSTETTDPAITVGLDADIAAEGCTRDVNFITSSMQDLSSSVFESTKQCLNEDLGAGRKRPFSCSAGASLLNDDATLGESDDEEAEQNGSQQGSLIGGLNAGAIAGIVIASICCLALIGAIVALIALRARAGRQDAMVMANPIVMVQSGRVAAADDAMFSARGDASTRVAPQSVRITPSPSSTPAALTTQATLARGQPAAKSAKPSSLVSE